MENGGQFEQLIQIIAIARIQLILLLNRLRTAVDQLTQKIIIARTLSSNNKIVSSRFFEHTNFEQLIMTLQKSCAYLKLGANYCGSIFNEIGSKNFCSIFN